jgi:hypothetical protein
MRYWQGNGRWERGGANKEIHKKGKGTERTGMRENIRQMQENNNNDYDNHDNYTFPVRRLGVQMQDGR